MQLRFHRAALAIAPLVFACGGTETVGTSNLLTGTYVATIFVVTPTGEAPINVLAAGGSLSIRIDAAGNTTGTLNVPGSVTGGAPFTASMAGTAIITALNVEFDQSADSFVRDLAWARVGTTIRVVDQQVGGASYLITLVHD